MASTVPINTIFPTPSHPATSTTSHTQKSFLISATKLPISKSGPIDEMSASLGIPVPEMIFGDNNISVEHLPSRWRIEFNAYDALDRVDKTGEKMLKVAYSREWTASREENEGIKDVVRPFDWSYSSDYTGTITSGPSFTPSPEEFIPLELLKRPDPILFFEEVVLYESELDDNGVSLFSCKVRVMPERMLLLVRNFMRLDDVIVRIRDTRIYIDFGTGKVIRDYTEKEGSFESIKQVCGLCSTCADVLLVFRSMMANARCFCRIYQGLA